MNKNDKIEIDKDEKIPPGLLFSTINCGWLSTHESYSMCPRRAVKFDTWTPLEHGYVPGYEAALFLRLLSVLHSKLSGHADSTIDDSWKLCLSAGDASDIFSALCVVYADILYEMTKMLAKVAMLGVSGFFLDDLIRILRLLSQGNGPSHLRDIVSVHSYAALVADEYLKDVSIHGLRVADKSDSANEVLYKLCAFVNTYTSPSDKECVPAADMAFLRYRISASIVNTIDAHKDDDVSGDRFATATFTSIPVIISEEDEDGIIANLPGEFVTAVEPLLESALLPAEMTKLQAMVRIAQSLFMYIARITSVSPTTFPDFKYGVHLYNGCKNVLPRSLSYEFVHDIIPQSITNKQW